MTVAVEERQVVTEQVLHVRGGAMSGGRGLAGETKLELSTRPLAQQFVSVSPRGDLGV